MDASEGSSAAHAERRGTLILATAAILFSLMALCAKAASARLPSTQVACMRFVIGMFAIAVPLLSGRGLHPSNYRALFLRGLFGGISVLLYFAAIAHLPVGVATILNSSWPGFVAIFAFLFLDEPLTLRAILSLLVTALGVALVVLGDARTGLLAGTSVMLGGGALFYGLCGLLSAVFSAAAVTTVRSMRKSEGSWEIFFAFCLVGSLVTGIPGAAHFVLPTFQEALWLLAMGTCSAFAQMGMTYALRDVRAVNAGIILQLTPIATLLLGVVLFAERPTPLAWIGAILTLFGVTWGTISR